MRLATRGLRLVLHPRPTHLASYPPIPPHGGTCPVRSARVFASGFLSAPLAGIQLPSATLRRHLTGTGLARLITSSFPLGCRGASKTGQVACEQNWNAAEEGLTLQGSAQAQPKQLVPWRGSVSASSVAKGLIMRASCIQGVAPQSPAHAPNSGGLGAEPPEVRIPVLIAQRIPVLKTTRHPPPLTLTPVCAPSLIRPACRCAYEWSVSRGNRGIGDTAGAFGVLFERGNGPFFAFTNANPSHPADPPQDGQAH